MGGQEKVSVMENKQPLVSICCLTFNHEDYVRNALDGFLMQKVDFAYEILIHDDASTDGTADIIREYEAKYPELIFPIIQSENQYTKGITHASGAFNFPRARGSYIAMCEGDDYWTDPDKLRLQVNYMEDHRECSICFHPAAIESVDGSLAGSVMRPYKGDQVIPAESMVNKTSGYATASLVFRTEAVKTLPEYYVNCPVGDIPMQLMAAGIGDGYYIDRPMCVYRVGVSTSWTKKMQEGNYEEKQRIYREQMKKTYEAFDKETGGRFHKEAVEAADRIYFLTLVNTKCYREIQKSEYRKFYRELDARTRFFIRFEIMAPGIYRLLQRLVRKEESH